MSSIQLLRVLVNERLSAAADEIFEAVKKTISGYEEELLQSKQELHRQRRMLEEVAEPSASQGGHSGGRALRVSIRGLRLEPRLRLKPGSHAAGGPLLIPARLDLNKTFNPVYIIFLVHLYV